MNDKPYIIEEERSEWKVPLFRWYWRRTDKSEVTPENPLGRHGAYPARWWAVLSAWRNTR